ncbi:MAG: hypothetical protein RLY31_173 [Bacteroidota bacterium]
MSARFLPALLLLSLLPVALPAQTGLLSPDEFLPYPLGSQFSEHSQLVAYFRHAADHSDRVVLQEFGRTNQQRPQLLAVVSSPENLGRLEEIRRNHLRNTGLEPGTADNRNPIAVVWLGFSVHGNEAAGSESSMAVLHRLASSRDSATSEWLRRTVVLMEPSVNPDGYSRYTAWYRQASPLHPDPDPSAREHIEPWPGGRVNHYLFDLNRDWAWATQQETRNRLAVYNQWLPHVVADLHEQYYHAPYYFAPAAQPYHTYLSPWQAEFQHTIGRNHAKYFDEQGWLYFTREVFDLLYPSYGDTYPCFNGAIGMTYEQGGHARAGRAILLPNRDTLTLADRIAHHRTTALSTVEMAALHAGPLVEQFADFFRQSSTNPPGPYKSYVIRADNPDQRIRPFLALLDRHGIRYGLAGQAAANLSGYDYASGRTTRFQLSAQDIVISAYQPKGRLTQTLLDPEAVLVDSLTYDVTAWSLVQAHGLLGYATEQSLTPANPPAWSAPAPPDPDIRPYAWLAPWNSVHSARFLAALLRQGVVARYAESAFTVEDKPWPAGTLLLTRADNGHLPVFDKLVSSIAAELGYPLTPAFTGLVSQGRDFGSDGMRLVETPKVLVLSGEKTFQNEFGQVWFFFDQDIDYPATYRDARDLPRIDLGTYNTLILPEGSYQLDESTLSLLSAWVEKGGRLITVGAANQSVADQPGFALSRFATDEKQENARSEAEVIALDHRTARFADREREALSDMNPGAVVRVTMDSSHPLAFGLQPFYFSLKTNNLLFDMPKNAWNVGYLEPGFRVQGFIGHRLRKRLDHTAVFAVQDKGRGQVVYLLDNPLFRSFWEAGKLVFSNALFLTN